MAKQMKVSGKVSRASIEQSTGIDQLATTLTQMERLTQETAASAHQSASSSEQAGL